MRLLLVAGRIDGIVPEEIGLINGSPEFETLVMQELEEIVRELRFDNLAGIEFEALLNDRVTNDGEHVMRGDITFEDDLQVHGKTTNTTYFHYFLTFLRRYPFRLYDKVNQWH